MRIDQLLVENKLARSRSTAQNLIKQGAVECLIEGQWLKITKPSFKLEGRSEVKIDQSLMPRYVSRAGEKLVYAIEQQALSVSNKTALDIGQSTGGFTDCLLQHGAKCVVGVDVGHDQLASKLRDDNRVTCLEGVNARNLSQYDLGQYIDGDKFDVIVMDISFISQTLVLPELGGCLKPSGWVVSLVKPQFEVGKAGMGKGGIVRDASLFESVKVKITELVAKLGFSLKLYCESPIKGGDGNKEFLMVLQKDDSCVS